MSAPGKIRFGIGYPAFGWGSTRFWANPLTNSKRVGQRSVLPRARHVGGRRRRARTERSPDPHTKLSVYSIDIVRLTPNQPEFRTCAPTKRHRKLPPQASVRAPPAHGESHPVLCKNRLRARIRRPCRPRSRRPSCSRGSAASKTSLMTFWPWKLEERRPESEGEVAARQRNVR